MSKEGEAENEEKGRSALKGITSLRKGSRDLRRARLRNEDGVWKRDLWEE